MESPNSEVKSNIVLAKWRDRFLAWLIDVIIVSTISMTVISLLLGPQPISVDNEGLWAENTQYIFTSISLFIYWTVLEYKTGQTIGKKILDLSVRNIDGGKPKLKEIMLSVFGKSFLLPIDVIMGRFLTNQKRQRMFNKLGDTVIIKIKETEKNTSTTYLKD